MSWSDWERQRAFASGHTGDITALAWSPNGALLASAGADRKVLLWDTKTQTIIARYDYANVMALAWHPTDNILSFTNSDGELFIYTDFVPTTSVSLLEKTLQPAPFIHDPLAEASANMRRPISDGVKDVSDIRRARRGTPDSLDDILGSDAMDDGDEFLEDDDGAGYAEMSGLRKRTIEDLDGPEEPNGKRRVVHETFRPKRHAPFQPGSTPWRGNRKYLCLNMTGSVWTVDQETHNTVTVEFYDREYHRDFHFTDPYFYDKACLNEEGTLFSCPPLNGSPAMIFYRPHETWTTRADWRTQLPEGEDITSIALSNSYIVVTTSTNYVRIFTLYGTPFRLYRQKSSSTVTCAAWRDYVLTMGNGPVGADGKCTLTYSIENVKRDEVCQSEDVVALPPGGEVRNVFFSDDGDPHIYDSSGTLLVLVHWRSPQQAHWVPLLDTRQLARLASGRHQESYFAVGVAGGRFQCFILKGVAERYPYFPRPLLSEFEFRMPISSAPKKRRRGKSGAGDADAPDNDNVDGHDDDDDDDDGERGGSNGASGPTDQLETTRLETSFLHASLRHALLSDLSTASHVPASSLSTAELEIDKTLLQLLALACRGSSSAAVSVSAESAGPKALELVKLMRDRSGRMVEAAGRVVERFGSGEALAERIREVGEAWLRGDEVEGDEGDELS
ncbi:MAG: hypothetical protein M1819_005172 [Sarea resinae]|nr:MAG: hypothetical protein M1819_005172 [Sarea resinae]